MNDYEKENYMRLIKIDNKLYELDKKLDDLNVKHDIFNEKLDIINKKINVLFELRDTFDKEILRILSEFKDDEE